MSTQTAATTRPWRRDGDPTPRPVQWMLAPAVLAVALTVLTSAHHPETMPALIVFTLAGAALATIDLDVLRIPTRLLAVCAAITAILMAGATFAVSDRPWTVLLRALIGATCCYLAWWLLALVTRGFGMGDVRLAAYVGMVTAWATADGPLIATCLGLVLSGLVALILKLTRPHASHLPFGPPFILAALIVLWTTPPSL